VFTEGKWIRFPVDSQRAIVFSHFLSASVSSDLKALYNSVIIIVFALGSKNSKG